MDVRETLFWLASLAPTRLTGGEGERRAHDAIAERLGRAGFRVEWQSFRFPRHIYGSLALHFGAALALAVAGRAWPLAAALGHLVVAVSFYAETTLRRHLLRALWPRVQTRNLLATWPARGRLRKRLVCVAHVDSAYTGLMFHPAVLRAMTRPPPRLLAFTYKQLRVPFFSVIALAVLEAAALAVDVPWPLVALACVGPALAFALNAEVVARDRVVPGAADNLSGCAAQIVLGEAWAARAPEDVELVLAFTGAEEAGTGGAAHLARAMRAAWSPADTVVLALDTLSNGELFVLEEGELFGVPVPAQLREAVAAGARDAGQPVPAVYPVPAGATDALPFLVEGYRAAALTCIDRAQGAPRNYHHPLDTAERVDPAQLAASTHVAERTLWRLAGASAEVPPEASALAAERGAMEKSQPTRAG